MTGEKTISKFRLSEDLSPYIIAEIGVNHGGDLSLAKRQIKEAAEGGAHAAKFQTYKADLLASRHSPAYWDTNKEPTKSQRELFAKYDGFGEQDYIELADYCSQMNLHFLSTPFDLNSIEFLTPLVPAFKIASADITNVPLIRQCSSKGKPMILSTGASSLPEIEFAVKTAREAGAESIALLHCVLNYPTPPTNAQLAMIPVLKRVFPDCHIGYSDHVVPDQTLSALEMATMLGSTILEKHFTHDKTLAGNDHYHAMDKADLQVFTSRLARFTELFGHPTPDLKLQAQARLHARRSVLAARDISAGELLTHDNLIAKRPGNGISPIHWDELIGRRANRDLTEDERIAWRDLDEDS